MIPIQQSNDRKSSSDDVQAFLNDIAALLTHIRSHASLRGEIQKLDPSCQICKIHFGKELARCLVAAA